MNQPTLFPETATGERFASWAAFHKANPAVWRLFRRYADEALQAGRDRLSARMIGERIRWYTSIETTETGPAINDHHWPYYARLLVGTDERFEAFFVLKDKRFDATVEAIVAAHRGG